MLRDEGRTKRDPRRSGDSPDPTDDSTLIEEFVGNEPTPEFAAQVAEEYERLLNFLDDDQRAIAVAKLEGLTNPEIAARLDRSLRTVERKLQLIRGIWERGGLT